MMRSTVDRAPAPGRPLAAALLSLGLVVLAACDADPTPGAASVGASAAVNLVPAQEAVQALEASEGDYTCAEPVPRADDFAWICEGGVNPVTATVHLYATQVDGPVFGATLYTQAQRDQPEEAADVTTSLALDLVEAAVPDDWRQAAASWIEERMPDGGRTLNVPDAGITASVQPLAAGQWYVELYELDGREG